MVIEQPSRRNTAALLHQPIAALSHPSHRSSRVTGPSSSSGHQSSRQQSAYSLVLVSQSCIDYIDSYTRTHGLSTRKVSHKKVCGFCNFLHILWKVTKLLRKLESDVTCHKILICVMEPISSSVVMPDNPGTELGHSLPSLSLYPFKLHVQSQSQQLETSSQLIPYSLSPTALVSSPQSLYPMAST